MASLSIADYHGCHRSPAGLSALQCQQPKPLEERKLKLSKFVLMLAMLASVSMQAAGYSGLDCKVRNDAMNVMTDVIVIRPVGFAVMLAGGALFLGVSPLTALASIPAPHDSFERVGAVLVGAPYSYTFVRPLGYFSGSCD